MGLGYQLSGQAAVRALETIGAMQMAGDRSKADGSATAGQLASQLRRQVKPGGSTLIAVRQLALQEVAAEPALWLQLFGQSAKCFLLNQSFANLARHLAWEHEPSSQ